MPEGPRRYQRGFTLLEFLVVALIIGVMLAVAIPSLGRFYRNHQVESSAGSVRLTVQRARMSALKEKRDHRVVIHDESSATPNRIELQSLQGGSFATLSEETRILPKGIRVLGNSPTDSLDQITINTRGECSAGKVYVYADGSKLKTVSIQSTCFTTAS